MDKKSYFCHNVMVRDPFCQRISQIVFCTYKLNLDTLLVNTLPNIVQKVFNWKCYIFCFKWRLNIQMKITVIENRPKKVFKFVNYMIVWKTKFSGARYVQLDLGREPDLLGSESDMYTVQAQCKIFPCVPPRTHLGVWESVLKKN